MWRGQNATSRCPNRLLLLVTYPQFEFLELWTKTFCQFSQKTNKTHSVYYPECVSFVFWENRRCLNLLSRFSDLYQKYSIWSFQPFSNQDHSYLKILHESSQLWTCYSSLAYKFTMFSFIVKPCGWWPCHSNLKLIIPFRNWIKKPRPVVVFFHGLDSRNVRNMCVCNGFSMDLNHQNYLNNTKAEVEKCTKFHKKSLCN